LAKPFPDHLLEQLLDQLVRHQPSRDVTPTNGETPMSAVTDKPKRYSIYVCAGCRCVAESERSDTLTCSAACRVRAHRNGSLKELHAIARSMDVRPGAILRAEAIQALRPDLDVQLVSGRLTIDEAQPQVRLAFLELLKHRLTETAGEVPASVQTPTGPLVGA
jgi:hypothetical protein